MDKITAIKPDSIRDVARRSERNPVPMPPATTPEQYAPPRRQLTREAAEFLEHHVGLQEKVRDLSAKVVELEADGARWRARAEQFESQLNRDRISHAETVKMMEAEADRIRSERDDFKIRWVQVTECASATFKSMQAHFSATLKTAGTQLAQMFEQIEQHRAHDASVTSVRASLADKLSAELEKSVATDQAAG